MANCDTQNQPQLELELASEPPAEPAEPTDTTDLTEIAEDADETEEDEPETDNIITVVSFGGYECGGRFNMDTNYGGHNATFSGADGKYIEFKLQPCDCCGKQIIEDNWDEGFCNCGEMSCQDHKATYRCDEIETFCSFLELGHTYTVSFASYFNRKYISHKLTSLFIIKQIYWEQKWTYVGPELTWIELIHGLHGENELFTALLLGIERAKIVQGGFETIYLLNILQTLNQVVFATMIQNQ